MPHKFTHAFVIASTLALGIVHTDYSYASTTTQQGKPAPQELHLSWETFEKDSHALAKELKNKGHWNGMVAITRGGLAPAVLLAHDLNIKNIDTISISSYGNDNKPKSLEIIKNAEIPNQGEGWLVIDDLVDSGKTLEVVRELLPKAHYAVLYAKPQGKPMVDTYVSEAPQEQWIFFPWEK